MPLVWLRVAVAFYACGLVYALLLVTKRWERLCRVLLPAAGLGMIFHLVSLVEYAVMEHPSLATVHHSESVLAFVLMFLFMVVRVRYKTTSHAIYVFPLVFFFTFASMVAQKPVVFTSKFLHSGWLFAHIALIFTGYAALFLSFGASLLYLIQARNLKSSLKKKHPDPLASRLPALEVLDDISYRSLLLGFPFMTCGLVMGVVLAQTRYGATFFTDPKVMLSLIMWVVYMVLLYTRWSAGWRGRRAAYLATFAFLVALIAWGANMFSQVHDLRRFIAS